ncbi:hypothetical protein JCM11641_008237 [Rhodosporidiobolus odoratus]
MTLLRYQLARLASGIELSYIDSWSSLAPSERPTTCTTLVGVHGVGFNSAVWTPLLPSLPPSIRFIAYNQRSYTGSSPALQAEVEGGVDVTAAYLEDLIGFLEFLVREEGVKGKNEGGGIALLGWSKGTVLPLSLLSYLSTTSSSSSAQQSTTSFLSHLASTLPALTALVNSHLTSLLLFEPPGSALGRAPTADNTTAMSSVSPPNSSTPAQFAEAFAGWIGQYSPPSTSSSSEPAVADLPPSGLAALSSDVLEASWQPEAVAHGFSWRLAGSATEVANLTRSALATAQLPVGLIYGGQTVRYCLEAAAEIERIWKEEKREGAKKTAVRRIEGTNHFGFVHKPREFVQAVVELIEKLGGKLDM